MNKVVRKHWNILSVNKSFKDVFRNKPVTTFKRNRNLREVFVNNKIEYNKVEKHASSIKKGKCFPLLVNNRTFRCKQAISSSTLKSQQTNKSYTIIHEINCSSAYVIYLMES